MRINPFATLTGTLIETKYEATLWDTCWDAYREQFGDHPLRLAETLTEQQKHQLTGTKFTLEGFRDA